MNDLRTHALTTLRLIALVLWRFAEYMDTAVHEVGHTLSGVLMGSPLRIKIASDASGLSTSSLGLVGLTPLAVPARILNKFAGPIAPVVFGLLLLACSSASTFELSGWTPWVVALFAAAALASSVSLILLSVIFLLGAWLFSALMLLGVPAWSDAYVMGGVEAAALLFIAVAVTLLFSARSWFTLLVTALWAVAAGVVLNQSLVEVPTALFIAGILFTAVGVVKVAIVGLSAFLDSSAAETDFGLLSNELGGSPFTWFLVFLVAFAGLLLVLTPALFF